MWWRQSRSEFERNKGEANRKAFFEIIRSGEEPGLIAYSDGEPVGWICVGPRGRFPALERSRVLARVDDEPVWSVVCFFIAKGHRRQGVSKALLEAAVKHSRTKGADTIEGYPLPRKKERTPDAFAWTGMEPIFEEAGFEVAIRRGKTGRGVWRLKLR
ncbi:GNAT family N-acetyltransferase [candidate division LCP-89 bacterium B3_LCP]|uniref:GNAT family N-acetyltransferase n=1 Tax=candidate division LCP-89 bacterium B3_LCP TaxID=2012998 RepID=A0A532UYR8_UNCL8|nr:MAG: GNAT family N-acetyltransferase [candidate division LCP-89 bacterium B3_LCP]